MAWTYYRDLRRKVGVMLRVRELSIDVLGNKPDGHDDVLWVQVDSRNLKRGTATLLIASRDTKPYRYTVSVVVVPENPQWIVER